MGVLKVKQTDGSWRNVGCGMPAPPGRLKLWTGTEWVAERCGSGVPATFTDTFTRADSTTSAGPDWTTGGNGAPVGSAPAAAIKVGINGNQLYPVSSNGGYAAWAFDNRFSGTDFDASITLSAFGASTPESQGIAFRIDPATGTHFKVTYNALYYLNSSFSAVQIGAAGGAHIFAAGDVMRVRGVGTLIEIYRNGTVVRSVTRTENLTVGVRHGVAFGTVQAAQRWDNWSISAVATPTPGRPLKALIGGVWTEVACMVPA